MGEAADLTVVHNTVIDTLHKEGEPEKVITERAGLFSERCIAAYSWRKKQTVSDETTILHFIKCLEEKCRGTESRSAGSPV